MPLGTFQRVLQGVIMPLASSLLYDDVARDSRLQKGIVPYDEIGAVVEGTVDTTRQLADHAVMARNAITR